MRILIISGGYPTEKFILNGIFEFDQAKALTEAGHEVIYAAIDLRSIRRWRKWGIEKKIIEGVKVYAINIPVGRLPKVIRQQLGIIGLKILVNKILREQGKPNIMHAHFVDIGYIASKIKNKINVPFAITEHSSSIMKTPIDKMVFHIASEAYKSADALIAVSPTLKNIVKKSFNKGAIYIPNIVDTKLFSYSQNKGDGIFRFVSVGNLIAHKRMNFIIEAFVLAFGDNEKVNLAIFGEGPERANLENLIDKHNIRDRITLMGQQSRNNIADYLKKCDCFVLASKSETFGVAYIEALASGLPVIATKCGGPESFVNDKNGLFVPIDDMNAIAGAMKNMSENISKYNRETISKEARNSFSPESIASSLISIYKDIINNKDAIDL